MIFQQPLPAERCCRLPYDVEVREVVVLPPNQVRRLWPVGVELGLHLEMSGAGSVTVG